MSTTVDPPAQPLRLGILGGRRGRALARAAERLIEEVEVVAMCDIDETVREQWRAELPDIRTNADEQSLLSDDDVEAIVVATPVPQHAAQAIAALQAGKHVLSEVLACQSIEQGQALVEAVDRTGLTYMMAENSCYTRMNLAVRRLAETGAFGRLSYLRGGYLHDVRSLAHDASGSLTWRGRGRARVANLSYPSHALGPLMHWLAAANGPDDLPVSLMAATSSAPATASYFRQTFGADHPGARGEFWGSGDTGSMLITTSSGAIVDIRVDLGSPRPDSSHTTYHELQGSRGLFLGSRGVGDAALVWSEASDGPEAEGAFSDVTGDSAIGLDKIISRYDHPLWSSRFGHRDELHGHDGGDFFVVERFAAAVRSGESSPIDVRTAVSWSVVAELSAHSIAAGGEPVKFPRL